MLSITKIAKKGKDDAEKKKILPNKIPPRQKTDFKQMRARHTKIPEAGEYLAYFPVSGIKYNAAIAA